MSEQRPIRYVLHLSVWDSQTDEEVVDGKTYNCNSLVTVQRDLRAAAEEIDRLLDEGEDHV